MHRSKRNEAGYQNICRGAEWERTRIFLEGWTEAMGRRTQVLRFDKIVITTAHKLNWAMAFNIYALTMLVF